MKNKKLPELLSPAGSPDALSAAVKAGADAVYIGGRMLNARMNAKNFSDGSLKENIALCHSEGVKVYVTLNTAVYDRELSAAVEYADFLYEAGADALIVSDLGFASAVSGRYPGMGLHASTQASGHNADCAKALAALGFDRMVCARELSQKEIRSLCENSPIEIEQFIHGAMCVSQSGQCLASAVMGGRSGNRGVCAQPCRMKYNGAFPLSLKDMCLAEHIPTLIDSGVASLKIEGRMKSPAYVYEVTRMYRELLDACRSADEPEIKRLSSVFSRGGFSDGYYTGNMGREMNGVRSEEDISATRSLKTEFRSVRFSGKPLTPPSRKVTAAVFIPPRAAKREKKPGKPVYTARFNSPEQVCGKDFFRHIYLPLDKYRPGDADGIILPPSIFPGKEGETENLLKSAREAGATEALICHAGQIEMVRRYGFTLHGDFRLNIFNTLCAKYCISLGLRDVILSPELTLPQMRDIDAPKCAVVYGRIPIMLLTKPVETKTSERAGSPPHKEPVQTAKERPTVSEVRAQAAEIRTLTDRTGAVFPVIKEAGFDILLNSVPFYMADKRKSIDGAGIRGRHFIFTTETKCECEAVIKAYRSDAPPQENIRRIAD